MKIASMKGYAVVVYGDVVSLQYTREAARELKVRLGGKENGVSIVQLVGKAEVR